MSATLLDRQPAPLAEHRKETVQAPARQLSKWEMLWYALLAGNLLTVGSSWLSLLMSQPLRNAIIPILALGFAVCAALLKRREFCAAPRSRSYAGLAVLCVVSITTTLSALFQLNRLHAMASIPLVGSFIWALFGLRRVRVIAPLLFLSMFILPEVPEQVRIALSMPLQHACTLLMGKICTLLIPISYYDHYFVVKGLTYDVAITCSGLSMLSTFVFAFAILQAFEKVKPIAYFSMIFLDPGLTLVLNSVRLVITALAAFFVSRPFALSIHSNLEYILVPCGMLLLFMLGRRFRVVC